MEEILIHNGLPALFVTSFLAATILPLGSEWLLVALVVQGADVEAAVAAATLGNYLGACTTFAIGFWGADVIRRKVMRIDDRMVEKARGVYRKYGAWSLLFSWLPIIGDPLCLIGGALRMQFLPFSILVISGKLARYMFVAYISLQL